MTDIALFDAKNRLSELIDRLQAGEVFTITRRGKPVVSRWTPGMAPSRALSLKRNASISDAMALAARSGGGDAPDQDGAKRRFLLGPPAHSGSKPGGHAGTGRLIRGGLMPKPRHRTSGRLSRPHMAGPSRPRGRPGPARAVDQRFLAK